MYPHDLVFLSDKARIDETSLAAVTSYDGLIPLTSKALKQPCILRRKRRKSNQENVGPPLVLPSPKAEPSSECDANLSVIFNQLTPLKTPVKHLPFSPSRVSLLKQFVVALTFTQ